MDNEERDFLRSQTDVQIWQTFCFTMIVLMVTCALGAWQIETTSTDNLPALIASVKIPIFFAFAIVGLISAIGTWVGLFKMRKYRKTMDEKVVLPPTVISPPEKANQPNEGIERKREVWLLFYGLVVALLIQIGYDSLNAFGSDWKLIISIAGAAIGMSLLVLLFPKIFPKKKS